MLVFRCMQVEFDGLPRMAGWRFGVVPRCFRQPLVWHQQGPLTEFDDLYDRRRPSRADNDIVTALARTIHGAIDRGRALRSEGNGPVPWSGLQTEFLERTPGNA